MAQYTYGETLTISTDNLKFTGEMPETPDLGESYYINTYIQMVAPGSKSQYVEDTLQLNWGGYTPESEEDDPTEGRRAFYLTTVTGYNDKYFCTSDGLYADFEVSGQPVQGTPWCTFNLHWSFGTDVDQHTVGNGSTSYPITEVFFESNLPIFETQAEAQQYIDDGSNYADAINFDGEKPVDTTTRDYFIYNQYRLCEVRRGIVSVSNNSLYQRNERILYNGERGICLYRNSDNPFSFRIKYIAGNLIGSIYSNTSVSDVSSASYEDFTLDELLFESPFYSGYNSRFGITNYDGYLGQFDTNLPLWDSEQDAQNYLDGLLDITQAPNWSKISSDAIWKKYINQTTGIAESATVMGQSYAQNFFSQLYLCTTGAITQIANSLYDIGVGTVSGLWDEIKKGVEMYGDDPMQSVQGLMFFPFNLAEIFTNVQDQSYVYFGGYKLDLQTTVKKVIFPNGYKSLGLITFNRTFHDWRDFEPYTKLYIYLPYVGTFQLQLSRYYGKSVEIRYYFDLRTGSCLVALLANGLLIDYFNGQLGVQLPITLSDKSNYANSQINTLLKGASSMGSVIKDVSSGIGAGMSVPVTGAFGALQAGISVSKTVYDITQNNKSDYNKTSGGSTSMLNEFLPQYAYFIFEIQQTEDSENVQSLIGFPSNKSGSVGEFSGYLEVETVNLNCGIATDNEKRQITNMLRTGVII